MKGVPKILQIFYGMDVAVWSLNHHLAGVGVELPILHSSTFQPSHPIFENENSLVTHFPLTYDIVVLRSIRVTLRCPQYCPQSENKQVVRSSFPDLAP